MLKLIDMGFATDYSANPKMTGVAGTMHIKLLACCDLVGLQEHR